MAVHKYEQGNPQSCRECHKPYVLSHAAIQMYGNGGKKQTPKEAAQAREIAKLKGQLKDRDRDSLEPEPAEAKVSINKLQQLVDDGIAAGVPNNNAQAALDKAKAEQEGKGNDLKSVLRELEKAEKHTAHLAGQVLKIESQLQSATEKHLMSADRLIKLRAQKSRLVKLEQAAEVEQTQPKVPELPKGVDPQTQEQIAQCVQAMAAAKQTMDQMHQQMEAIVKLASEKAAAEEAEKVRQ